MTYRLDVLFNMIDGTQIRVTIGGVPKETQVINWWVADRDGTHRPVDTCVVTRTLETSAGDADASAEP